MRRLLVFPVVAILLTAAEAPAKKPAGIPAGAVLVAPGSYRYTDQTGTAWIYRQTPFGVARLEEKPAAEAASAGQDYIRATEDGDTVRFERPGPFGPYRWQRKKSELSESERAIWDRQRSAGRPSRIE
jgi:hypothetical protein